MGGWRWWARATFINFSRVFLFLPVLAGFCLLSLQLQTSATYISARGAWSTSIEIKGKVAALFYYSSDSRCCTVLCWSMNWRWLSAAGWAFEFFQKYRRHKKLCSYVHTLSSRVTECKRVHARYIICLKTYAFITTFGENFPHFDLLSMSWFSLQRGKTRRLNYLLSDWCE